MPISQQVPVRMKALTAEHVSVMLAHEDAHREACKGMLGVTHCFICAKNKSGGQCSRCGVAICGAECLHHDWKTQGIHRQLCGALQTIGQPGGKRGRPGTDNNNNDDDDEDEDRDDSKRLLTAPNPQAGFTKHPARYRMGLLSSIHSRLLEYVGDIAIYLVAFNDASHFARDNPDKPLGMVAIRRQRSVYLFWNTDRASLNQVKFRLQGIRKAIRNYPNRFRPKVHQGSGPPDTFGRAPFGIEPESPGDDEDPEIYQWSVKMLARMHHNPKFRKEMAARMSFPSIFHRSTTDGPFNHYLGVHNDFWFHVLVRLLRADDKAIQWALGKLMREELSKDLDTVLRDGYFEKGDYRSMFFSTYKSVYLTEESHARDVVAAAVQEFSLSGGPAPWDFNVTLPSFPTHEARKRHARRTAPEGFVHGAEPYEIWLVIKSHPEYLETLWEDAGNNTTEAWGMVRDPNGNERMVYSEDVKDMIRHLADWQVKRGVLAATRWTGMGGHTIVRYMVSDATTLAAIKRFPPLNA